MDTEMIEKVERRIATPERSAYDWGLSRVPRPSCIEALRWRESLGTATQRDAWKECHRGDWLIWQLRHGLTGSELAVVLPALLRAVDTFVDRAVETHCLSCGVPAVELWAAKWLDGSDRSAWSTRAERAAERAAYAASALRIANDIREQIPEWIWAT
jgi:hypothetical protein